jgi:hypothetical protein
MEDNISQDQYDHLSSATPVTNSVIIVPRTVDDELHDVSLNENDDYLSNNLSHIHLLHSTVSTDPTLNHHNTTSMNNNTITNDLTEYQHGQVLQYYTGTSSEPSRLLKSKAITTPLVGNPSNYDPNSDITFLYDLVTPPTTTSTTTRILRQSITSQSNINDNNNNTFFDDNWTG